MTELEPKVERWWSVVHYKNWRNPKVMGDSWITC